MSSKRIHPRPDQIAELTRGHVLPLEAISALYMQIIAECLNPDPAREVRSDGFQPD